MTLFILLFIPLIGGMLAWYSEKFNANLPKKIALVSLLCCWLPLFSPLNNIIFNDNSFALSQWLLNEPHSWIPIFNIGAHLAMDGLSLLLIVLTLLMGLVALSSAWHEITKRTGFFYLNLLWTLAGVIGVFLAIDLFLFFVFWEVMLVPMYFLISIWGYENRHYAAIKFFIFTQAGGLLMLLSLCALVGVHFQQTGLLTFDYIILLQNPISGDLAFWIALGFTIAFLVKLPALPFHSWLPDAHTQAPTAASVILAAVLLKTGGYGIIRFVLPLFPDASLILAPSMMLIGVIGIIYGAMMAFVQTDLKRLVAYSSVSHMGFVLLGCFAFNIYALQGAVMQMLAHGISTSALFVLVGMIQHRYHTRDLNKLGGLWSKLPKLSAFGLFFGIASLGMPGLGNFVAEFLILLGSFEQYPKLTIFAASGLILAAIYSLLLIYKTFFGQIKGPHDSKISDTNTKEWVTLLSMCFILIYLGLHPQPFFDLTYTSLTNLTFIPSNIGS
ncbi:complex I subunit 4 family protein [Pseudoalteromonas denitrificans]|uniref:NADH-quinone oxidoreductase subunit M n=1 Tax=Pseudoalteromonas denitrificans DSM 6059 TaxID=1123010 RepID=A0A1I1P305_9GAMM|nr:NADH-quinone oxidoreductase subunit M [Pseudoalteromonas denitrificans]SFD04334.1 NADH dehydrogenase subunit M [Pseudoalteromonas denitrificans DSM 6059]